MPRETILVNDEYYHIYNRGVDKRVIFQDDYDILRFFQSMQEFNTSEPIGSIYQNSFHKNTLSTSSTKCKKLVEVICYCLNPNHFHFILKQTADNGIAKFMQKIGGGYTRFFNERHKRSGCLFQGKFKSQHIGYNEYLLHASVYVNLNNQVHQLSTSSTKSSWKEYLGEERGICYKDPIIKQFNNMLEYKKFAENQLEFIKENKKINKLLELDLLSTRSTK